MTTARYCFLFMVAAAAASATDPATATPLPPPLQEVAPPAAVPPVPLSDGERGASQCKTMTLVTRGVVAEAGKRLLELEVRNSGERALSSELMVDLIQKGEAVGQFRAGLQDIAPGNSVRHRIDLTELPAGTYQALAIVQNRDGDISGSREILDFE
ncbi:hypothetical protein LPW11_02710 [Geomonas sp. RF6]|uniref:hypothetical protein n=1 Tax=Geomonas sp. RF6 TaxID=2897342 RepID=UPI001E3E36D7|nr:hypothetical protein [Geomonas sp. RF6]UFS71110.1 hypothetical protein LPW11_02710 [Geomonas sp. RF6]